MDKGQPQGSHRDRPLGPWSVLAGAAVVVVVAASLSLLGRGEPETRAVATPDRDAAAARRPRPPALTARPRREAEPRLPPPAPAGAQVEPQAAGEMEAARDPQAAAEEEDAEEVIDNEPGREQPRGIDAAEYIQKLRDMGYTDGIAAFPPPGTNPPRAGVIVPDDYELPPGYERYHQSTDDGRPLAPILRFSPDYDFVDADGNPIAMPEDRIVPPDLIPDDLPLEMLDPENPAPAGGLVGQTP